MWLLRALQAERNLMAGRARMRAAAGDDYGYDDEQSEEESEGGSGAEEDGEYEAEPDEALDAAQQEEADLQRAIQVGCGL